MLKGSLLKAWFKQSFVFCFISKCILYLKQSKTWHAFLYMVNVIRNSKIASFFRFILSRKFDPESIMLYRAFEKINKKSFVFRDRVLNLVKHSLIYRLMSSEFFRKIARYFIAMVSLYAFIDELGRQIFSNFSLFALWDEIFLLLSALLVFMEWFLHKRTPLNWTPVSAPLLLLIAASFFLFMVNSKYPQLGFEGMRVVTQYVLWFFVLNSYLDDDKKAYLVTKLLVYAGGVMGLHGIIQYVIRVPTPKNWMDAAEREMGQNAYNETRVFSIVGSPNVLGSIFILIIPLCFALALKKHAKIMDRTIFILLLGGMCMSLILTQSRGAWAGAALALGIFCLIINPRWLLLLGIGCSSTLLIPWVRNRILYMLSQQYFINSLAGGRFGRYLTGLKLFQNNSILGVGLGHFGGAVAMNNKRLVPDTFYMDSYWLKTAVEMGSVGLIVFGVLMFSLTMWSIRAIKFSSDYDSKLITAGGFAGLFGVLFHNLSENIFEVPYMVVYFWVVASIVFYFGLRKKNMAKI